MKARVTVNTYVLGERVFAGDVVEGTVAAKAVETGVAEALEVPSSTKKRGGRKKKEKEESGE